MRDFEATPIVRYEGPKHLRKVLEMEARKFLGYVKGVMGGGNPYQKYRRQYADGTIIEVQSINNIPGTPGVDIFNIYAPQGGRKLVTEPKKREPRDKRRTCIAPVLLCYDTYDKAYNGYATVPDLMVIMKDLEGVTYAYPPSKTDEISHVSADYRLLMAADAEDYAYISDTYLMYRGTTDKEWSEGNTTIKVKELENVTDWSASAPSCCYDFGYGNNTVNDDWYDYTTIHDENYTFYDTLIFPDMTLTGPTYTGHYYTRTDDTHLLPDGVIHWWYSINLSSGLDYTGVGNRHLQSQLVDQGASNTSAYTVLYYSDAWDACINSQEGYHPAGLTLPTATQTRSIHYVCKTPNYRTDLVLLDDYNDTDRWALMSDSSDNTFSVYLQDLAPQKKYISYVAFDIFEVAPSDYAFIVGYIVGNAVPTEECYDKFYYVMVYHGEAYRSEAFERVNIGNKPHIVTVKDGVTYYGSGYVRMVEIEETTTGIFD